MLGLGLGLGLGLLLYRNYSKFVENNSYRDIEAKLQNTVVRDYASFHSIFHGVLNNHEPHRKKFIRANQKSYVTKKLRKAIMKRSRLDNKFNKNRSVESGKALKKQQITVTDSETFTHIWI